MKIIALTPNNPETVETPEQMYLRKLEDLGHEVLIGESFLKVPDDTDVVVAMSEVSCENAFQLASAYNLPFYAHMEWLPRWRVFLDDEINWGMEETPIDYFKKMNFVKMYQHYSFFWSMAEVKSLAADCFHKNMKDFMGRDLEIETKILGADMDKINDFLENNEIVKHNEVTCVARFVPHKRIHHVIKALQMIKFDGTLNLVGYGSEKNLYEEIRKDLKIKYWDSKDKLEALARAKVSIALWSGIVPIESMYVNTPVISYESDYMRELFSDTLIYAINNNIENLSAYINKTLNMDADYLHQKCEYGRKRIENKEIKTYTQDESVKMLESFIKKAVENKK